MARQSLRSGPLRQPVAAARRRLFRWQFLAEVWGELQKAEWPTRQEGMRLTGIVIAISVAVGFVLGGIDFLFNLLARAVFWG